MIFPRYSRNSHHIPARFQWYSHVLCEIVWTTLCPIFPVATPPPNSERCSNHRCQLGQFATPHEFGTLWQLHPGPVFSQLHEIHWPGMLEREFLCHMPWNLRVMLQFNPSWKCFHLQHGFERNRNCPISLRNHCMGNPNLAVTSSTAPL